jgi:iron complex outermembrane receptor protein
MRTQFLIGVAAAAIMLPGAAYAQSAGSTDFEGDIVITATKTKGVGGVEIPDTTKARGVLNQQFISRQTPGNSILDTINALPGVSFQNNDPFGSGGGTLTIRGFDSSRIGLTFDGVPLNDTGNYALYSNQQLDPELIEQVNVSYGSTDVDSPTAAASGSTVNYRTIMPTDDFGARLQGSIGDYNFFRIFGLINTGKLTSFGTKAWLSMSHAENNVVFNNFGKIRKAQYNGRVYQPIGSNGDFISIAANYNVNRNNFFGSAPLRYDTRILSQITKPNLGPPVAGTATDPLISPTNPFIIDGGSRLPGTGTNNRFPFSRDELPYSIARCQTSAARAGLVDSPAIVNAPTASNNGQACGASFDERYNPSNTGNIRVSARFTLAQGLVLTVEPSFQYVKANGGGTVTGREGVKDIDPSLLITNNQTGFIGGSYYFGRDLNGDGDKLDTVTLLAPSQTVTHRYGLISSLRYDLNDNNTIRVAYSHDYGRHRQTGELGYLQANGVPFDVFPINNPILDSNGRIVEKRDRLSFAVLDQVSGEYRGTFGGLTVNLGVRAPWFKRNLHNFCFTTSASGFVDCFGRGNDSANSAYALLNPGYGAPGFRQYKYNRVLPNGGATYKFGGGFTAYVNYSKGLQVPGTDNLYQDFFYAANDPAANPKPETSDNFDGGIRYTTSKIQATLSPWYTRFTNRLASSYDVVTDQTIYRNLGRVDKYGIDGSIAYRPIRELLVYAWGSYLKSEIKNNVEIGKCIGAKSSFDPTLAGNVPITTNCPTVGAPILAQTAGKRESGSPTYTYGLRLQGDIGPLSVGVQGKVTGPRYMNDQNLPIVGCTGALVNQACVNSSNALPAFANAKTAAGVPLTYGTTFAAYGAKTPAYGTVDVDVRLNLAVLGLNDKTFFQVNVQNVFNKYYVGGFSGGSTIVYNTPFVQIGSPRAFIGTVNFQF